MGDAIISRRGGATLQALAPTITEVSTSINTIVFTLTNNDTESATILFETNENAPDGNSIELAAGATSDNITITGLTVSPAILYASANIIGKVKSNITERSFTLNVVIYTVATGGSTTEYVDGGTRYRSHTFTSNGTFEVTTVGEAEIDYLIIGGGGAGGTSFPNTSSRGGGGGAGGFRTTSGTQGGLGTLDPKVVATTTNVIIGAGASRAGDNSNPAQNGVDSSAFGFTAFGGGGGGNSSAFTGGNGGSGGGGGQGFGNSGNGGVGTANQGFNGASATSSGTGGGGGAGGAGSVTTGGIGLANSIRTGVNETFANGSNGTNNTLFMAGTDGFRNSGAGGTGTSNGPSSFVTGKGGNGGSGIVIIRYEIAPSL